MVNNVPKKLFKKNCVNMVNIARNLDYRTSEELYSNPEHYNDFIGEEILDNAFFCANVSAIRQQQGRTDSEVVETAAGAGASILFQSSVLPEAKLSCVEWSQALASKGSADNPNIDFLVEDMTAWTHPRPIDLLFNSASSLSFFTIEQLYEHIQNVARQMTDGASYYADLGFYASVQAANTAQVYLDREGKTHTHNMTLEYFPATDIHHIVFSRWQDNGKEEMEFEYAYGHKLRAYRFSEWKFLAKLAGLEARLWGYDWCEKTRQYIFTETDDKVSINDGEGSCFLFELYKGDAVRLDGVDLDAERLAVIHEAFDKRIKND